MDTTLVPLSASDLALSPSDLSSATDVSLASVPDPSTDWGSLDTLGSGVSNVASSILTSYGNLVSAQVNRTALLTATGKTGVSLTGAPLANANSWGAFLLIGVAALGVVAVIWAVKKHKG